MYLSLKVFIKVFAIVFVTVCHRMHGYAGQCQTYINWTSTTDNMYRSHCYFYIPKDPSTSSGVNIYDANRMCIDNGGTLAPHIDLEQNYVLYTTVPATIRENPKDHSVGWDGFWVGLNNLRESTIYENWITEPYQHPLNISPSNANWNVNEPGGTEQYCHAIIVEIKFGKNQTGFADLTCGDKYSQVVGVLCYMNLTAQLDTDGFDRLLDDMRVPIKNTTAYKNKFISIREDDPSALGLSIGYIGAVIIALIFGLLLLSDICSYMSRRDKVNPKKSP